MTAERFTDSRITEARRVIEHAERTLGPLSDGQLRDLLMDNFGWLLDSAEAGRFLAFLRGAA